jgi:ABC-type antimicrobial peptide transport system permease subunit
MARRLWPRGGAVGGRVRLFADGAWRTVVGVAGDVYQFQYDQAERLAVYYPRVIDASVPAQQSIVVRTAVPPDGLVRVVKEQIWAVDREQPLRDIATAETMYARFFAEPRFYAVLMGLFAGIGALLAAVGVYGVLSYTTTQRTQEFGIRLALGAEPRQLARLVIAQGLALAAVGLACGAAAGLGLGRSLRALIFGVAPGDPLTLLGAAILLAGIVVLASTLPARRASRVDPVVSLRSL